MNNAPVEITNKLESDNFEFANLLRINLGDAYDTGSDFILYYTDHKINLSLGGNTYISDNHLTELDGISRKASTGSDQVDISFGVTDEVIVAAIRSERYANKATAITRVIVVEGEVFEDYEIPVRTAWGISHSITGDLDDRVVTLVIDTSLGELNNDNGWYTLNASHEKRHLGDKIMKWSSTVFTEEQKDRYTTNFTGTISQDVKPPALPKIYGYKNVTCVPILRLQHRKTHTFYRHYYTTWIYVVGIGEMDFVDTSNLRRDGEDVDMEEITTIREDAGGWSFRLMQPSENNIEINSNNKLDWFRARMDGPEVARLEDMYGKGLTLLYVKNRNRDDWVTGAPELTIPVRGAKCFDPRTSATVFTRNPMLQYADFLRSSDYGAGGRNIGVSDANVISVANHFDNLPGSNGNPGINSILMDLQIDTGLPIVDNMNIWIEGARLYTSDYYGEFLVRVETIGTSVWSFDEDDLEDDPDYDSGEFTDRITRLTYKVKQLVPDVSEDAEPGDLVEVDVEATFPPIGSTIFDDWLEEDGNVENFESEQLDYVTELEQGFYWAMVDSRISRQPRMLTLPVGPIAWLFEVGDIITYTSSISLHDNTLWRILSIKEQDGGVSELECVGYDDNFYTPDPNSIPAPVAFAQPPTANKLGAIVGFEILNRLDRYYLNFAPLTDSNVSYYAVEIEDDTNPGVFIFDEPQLTAPPYLLENIGVGNYTANVTPVGVEDEGITTNYAFAVGIIQTPIGVPDTSATVPGRIVVEPPTPEFESRTYEWRYRTNLDPTLRYIGDNRILNLSPIVENVTYIIEYRLKFMANNTPPGTWREIQVDGVEQLLYTWLAYADDAAGNGISLSPTGKDFYGVATGRTTPTVSIADPSVYVWVANAPEGSGSPGTPAINGSLSLNSIALSADEDGLVKSYIGAVTTMVVTLGIVDDSGAWNFTASVSTGLAGSLVGQTFTVTSLTADNAYVDITASRVNYASITKRFAVTRVKDGPKPINGTDYFDGKTGDYITFVFTTNKDRPNRPTGGTFDGTTEVMPTFQFPNNAVNFTADNNPVFVDGNTTFVSVNRYRSTIQANGSETWAQVGVWSLFETYSKQGEIGNSVWEIYNSSSTLPGAVSGDGTNDGWGYTLLGSSRYKSQAIQRDDPRDGGTTVWSTPYLFVGEPGPVGPPGGDAPGANTYTDDTAAQPNQTGPKTIFSVDAVPAGTYTINYSVTGNVFAEKNVLEPIEVGTKVKVALFRDGVQVGADLFDPSSSTFETFQSYAFSGSIAGQAGDADFDLVMTITYQQTGVDNWSATANGFLQLEEE